MQVSDTSGQEKLSKAIEIFFWMLFSLGTILVGLLCMIAKATMGSHTARRG